jgi:hypothetical protein
MTQTYSHSPGPSKAPISFALDGDRLTVDSGRKVQEVRLGAVEQVRLTYEPKSLGRNAFQTRLRLKDGKTVTFSSINWKSLVDVQRLDREYRIFSRALLDAIVHANPEAHFIAGRPRLIWGATLFLAVIALAAITVFIWRALQAGAGSAALMGVLFALVGIWQIEPMVRLNKPRRFTPSEPPADLMP